MLLLLLSFKQFMTVKISELYPPGRKKNNWNSFERRIYLKYYLKLQDGWGCISIVDGDFPKQRSHTRTGVWPQPRSGTGFLLVEHSPQTPPPQARQWCLVSPSANTWWHSWHAYEKKPNKQTRNEVWNWESTSQTHSPLTDFSLRRSKVFALCLRPQSCKSSSSLLLAARLK